jgi:hypothetical protein
MRHRRCFLAFCLFVGFSSLSQAMDDKETIVLPNTAIFSKKVIENSNNKATTVILLSSDLQNNKKFTRSLFGVDYQLPVLGWDFMVFHQVKFRIYYYAGLEISAIPKNLLDDAAAILILDDSMNLINKLKKIQEFDIDKYKVKTIRYDEKTCEFNFAAALKEYNPTSETKISCSADNVLILGKDLFIKIENELFGHLYLNVGQ